MTSNIELSEKQKSIVLSSDGAIYVKASPGSGKTRVLTERVRHLLTKTKKKVLAITFTNKAGEEIRERLSDISEIEKRIFIGTFHGFCQSILENHGHLIGFDQMPHIFEDESDRLELIEQAVKGTPSHAVKYKNITTKKQKNFRYRALEFISKIKRELIAESELEQHTQDEDIILLYQNYQDILRNQNAIDFDDLLLFAYSLLTNFPKIASLYRRSFHTVCVDEAQDLNNAQYQLLLSLANGEFSNLMMVGDPNQSIYHFNGSSPKYMNIDFVNDFSPTIFQLNENYRSSISVLAAAKKVIPEADDIASTVKEGLFEIKCLANEFLEAEWVVNKVNELLSWQTHPDIEGNISLEKIVVLARNKYIFNQLEEKLDLENIPFYYRMNSGAIKFESKMMNIFELSLRVRLNKQDVLHKSRLLKLLKLNSGDDLNSILTILLSGDAKKLVNLVINLREDGSNLKTTLNNFKEHLIVNDENERSMICNDISELIKHWHNYAKKVDNKSLHQFKNAMALGQTHPNKQHSGLTLSTVHTMKGQESDIVFIIGMDDETFPDYRAVKSGGIKMTQERNNLYVAFTRAKRFLFITWPQERTMPWGTSKCRKISRLLNTFS